MFRTGFREYPLYSECATRVLNFWLFRFTFKNKMGLQNTHEVHMYLYRNLGFGRILRQFLGSHQFPRVYWDIARVSKSDFWGLRTPENPFNGRFCTGKTYLVPKNRIFIFWKSDQKSTFFGNIVWHKLFYIMCDAWIKTYDPIMYSELTHVIVEKKNFPKKWNFNPNMHIWVILRLCRSFCMCFSII